MKFDTRVNRDMRYLKKEFWVKTSPVSLCKATTFASLDSDKKVYFVTFSLSVISFSRQCTFHEYFHFFYLKTNYMLVKSYIDLSTVKILDSCSSILQIFCKILLELQGPS